MAGILDRYGIKEVADVTFYKINDDGTAGEPVLFLDTLKVSTIEQTASSSDARGGKGNAKLISWDFDKEISVTLEDALFSPKSLSIMYGSQGAVSTSAKPVHKTLNFIATKAHDSFPGIKRDPVTGGFVFKTPGEEGYTTNDTAIINNEAAGQVVKWYNADGTAVTDASTTNPSGANEEKVGSRYMCSFWVQPASVKTVEVDAAHFPGTYYIVGDTYARNDATGVDEFFQFVIYKAKVSPENTITLQADGDPSTFSMNLTVLRDPQGRMMDLIQYTLPEVPKV